MTTLTVRTPEDLVAAVPVLLGFEPANSVVLVTLAGPARFHARVDLPTTQAESPELIATLLSPAVRHRVELAALLIYGPDTQVVRDLAVHLASAADSLNLLEILRVDEGHYFGVLPDSDLPVAGVPLTTGTHPFAAQAVLDGRVTHASRGALAATIASDPMAVTDIDIARQADADPLPPDQLVYALTHAIEAGQVDGVFQRAGVLLALAAGDLPEDIWRHHSRDTARHWVEVWRSLVRAAPPDLLATPAALLAFAAWLTGDGALAWCGLDRCFAADPHHPLGHLILKALDQAVPPSSWETFDA